MGFGVEIVPSDGPSAAYKAGLVVNWILSSATLILFNKWLLTSGGFPYPVSLTLLHQIFCSVVAFVGSRLQLFELTAMPRDVYLKGVVPVGACYAIALWFGNWAYLYLQVSFVQMLKAFMPVTVFFIGICIGTEKFNLRLCGILFVVCVGVLIASYGEVYFSIFGVLLQIGSMATEASRLGLLQHLLQKKGYKLNPMTTMYYLSPITAAFLFVLWFGIEAHKVSGEIGKVNPLVLLLNCSCALFLNLAVFLIVGKTSALTMNICGVIKDWIIIIFSVLVFKSILTILNVVGFTIAFMGVLGYNQVRRKMNEAKALAARPEQGQQEEKALITREPESEKNADQKV